MLVLVWLWIIGGGRAASAQDEGRVALSAASPASVGVNWRVAEHLALRPDITFAESSGETTTTVNFPPASLATSRTSDDTSSVTLGMSALLYVRRWDALRVYLVPRVAYTRSTIHSLSAVGASANTNNTTVTAYGVSGSFGGQYAFSRRFGVFGEVGVAYSDTTAKTNVSFSSSTRSIGSRSGVGVLFFF